MKPLNSSADMLVTASWNKLELPEQENNISLGKNGTNHEKFLISGRIMRYVDGLKMGSTIPADYERRNR